ncbi:MAG: hypothetical protein CM15mV85_190 [uncultured marine virus]|nr:MAG: hypothetical protein CM15mV85_190 [uncultured marine virus]
MNYSHNKTERIKKKKRVGFRDIKLKPAYMNETETEKKKKRTRWHKKR